MDVPVAALLQAAVTHHQAGRLAEAEALYQQVLQVLPSQPDALHLLGVIARQTGRYEDAAELIGKAIDLKPSSPMYNNLGNALKDQGRLDAAVESYRKALALQPDYAEAHFNLGTTLKIQGKLDAAVESYREALALRPDYAEAHNDLGIALQAQGKFDAAIEHYHSAISVRPGFAEAHNNLGTVLKDQGKLDAAIESYQRAIAIRPDFAEAHNNLGVALKDQGKLDAAIESCRRAIAIRPDFAGAYGNLGTALKNQGKLDEAVESYCKALAIKPDYAEVYSNLLYLHAFTRDISPEMECSLAAGWEDTVLSASEKSGARNRALSAGGTFDRRPRTGRKLRLGIVSAEIGQHAVAEFLEPFLEQLDRNRFHTTLYPTAARSGPRTARLLKLADDSMPLVALSDSAAADRIRSDRIDVLIDTTGHMSGCRLGIFAHRAAPVQCHYIGYHGTTGLTEMDWFIADEELLPSSCDSHFREGIWRLPRLWISYHCDAALPDSKWMPDPGGTVWLGSFNNLTKVREQTLALWAKVMIAVPESKLLLKDPKAVDYTVQERIRTELSRHGIGEERIEFAAWAPDWNSHMALYDRLDIALDTIPLNSGTTAFDALWMGVPLVALEGDWMGGRMTGAMLKALGRPEWIARNEDEYVAIAAALAKDVEKRKLLRANQRTLMAGSQLCDAKGLARSLEDAFEAMFDRWLTTRENARLSNQCQGCR